MKTRFATIAITGVFGSLAMILATPVIAAPAGPSAVDVAVDSLKADGYNVILNRTGAAALSQCTVSAVRPGHEVSRTDSGHPGDTLGTTVVSKTVYVDVTC